MYLEDKLRLEKHSRGVEFEITCLFKAKHI